MLTHPEILVNFLILSLQPAEDSSNTVIIPIVVGVCVGICVICVVIVILMWKFKIYPKTKTCGKFIFNYYSQPVLCDLSREQ